MFLSIRCVNSIEDFILCKSISGMQVEHNNEKGGGVIHISGQGCLKYSYITNNLAPPHTFYKIIDVDTFDQFIKKIKGGDNFAPESK